MFLAYESTVISANDIIYHIGYLEKTGKTFALILMKSNIYNRSKNARKLNFMKKKLIKSTCIFNRRGMLMHVLVVKYKIYIVYYRKDRKTQISLFRFPAKQCYNKKKQFSID